MSVSQTRIWLTTVGAVDEQFRPGRQVADHPSDPHTPVWLLVYEGYQPPILYQDESGALVQSVPETRVLRVVDATNVATREGAFVYLYGWTDLASQPELPQTMPEP